MRVLLVETPFAPVESPSLALSTLKARLVERGVGCDVLYANLAFAGRVGTRDYAWVATGFATGSLAGEWVFARGLFGPSPRGVEDEYLGYVLHLQGDDRVRLQRVRDEAESFATDLFASVTWAAYDVVGFASSFDQNLAALTLARRVKEAYPGVTIVVGGANWAERMGVALLRHAPFVDVAFLGEADDALPALVAALERRPGHLPLDEIAGIAYRRDGAVHVTGEARVEDLDALPLPDFGDYFAALDERPGACDPGGVTLWLQTSRGCWWGETQPCRFCGLNGPSRRYRTKSPRRIVAELREVVDRFPGHAVNLSDTVVSPAFLEDVLPALAVRPLGAALWFEARPSLERRQVQAIAAAGASIQVGIESLSDRVLRLMCKGSTVLQGLRLLKWCKEYGVAAGWSIMYDVPGESDDDLNEMIRLMPALRPLPPPSWVGSMSLDRFGEYHAHPGRYAISGVEPAPAYAAVYPWPDEELGEIASSFVFSRHRSLLRRACIRRLEREVACWHAAADVPEIRLRRGAGGDAAIEVVHGSGRRTLPLDEVGQLVCAALDEVTTRDELVALLARSGLLSGVSAATVGMLVDEHLTRLVDEGVVVPVGDRYLSLVEV